MALVPREPTGRDAHQKASQQVLMRERGDPGGSQAQAGATAGGTQEADSRSRASGCRAGKGSQMTKPRSCDQRLLPATQSLSHRLWAFRGQRGPWKVWEEPHSQGGPRWGRKRSRRREQECGHLTEPLLLGPTLTNTRYAVVETHSPWQGAKWLERTQPWLPSGRMTFERPLHQETLRLGTKTGLPTGPISDATAPQPADTSPSSRITGDLRFRNFPVPDRGFPMWETGMKNPWVL